MANLDSCYFCGAADDVDRYAVVPGRLNPSEDEQRSVALCPTCFDKLRTVIEPLISRIDASGAGGTGGSGGSGGPGGPGGSPSRSRSTDISQDGSVSRDGTGQARSGASQSGPSRGQNDGDGSPADDPGTDGMPSQEDLTAEREAARDAMRMSQGKPAGYRKVMRLLENRSFPVRRSTIAELAKDAYGIAPQQAEEIIATAIEDGHLTEDREDPDVLYRGNQ